MKKNNARDKKKKKIEPPPVETERKLTNVEIKFYELEIEDINKKINRLKTAERDDENGQFEAEIKDLIENREDPLSKQVSILSEANTQFEKLTIEHRTLVAEKAKFIKDHAQAMVVKDNDNKLMIEEKTAEIRHLTAAINIVQSFKANRESMIEHFNDAEKNYNDREAAHQHEIDSMNEDLEIYKSNVKVNVDRQLLKLSVEFVKKCEKTLPPHTLRIVRENISMNTELDRIHMRNQMLETATYDTEKNNIESQELMELNAEIIKKCNFQRKNISRLTGKYENACTEIGQHTHYTDKLAKLQTILERTQDKNQEICAASQFLKQDIEAMMGENQELSIQLDFERRRYARLLKLSKQIQYHFEMLEKFGLTDECEEQMFQLSTMESRNEDVLHLLSELEETLSIRTVPSLESVTAACYRGMTGTCPIFDDDDFGAPPPPIYQPPPILEILPSKDDSSDIEPPESPVRRVCSQTIFDEESDDNPLIYSDSEEDKEDLEDEEEAVEGDEYSSDDGPS